MGEGEVSSTGLKLERFITCSVQILAEKIMGKKSRIMCKLDNMNEKKGWLFIHSVLDSSVT